MKVCSYCGRENEDAVARCKGCGTEWRPSVEGGLAIKPSINFAEPYVRALCFSVVIQVAFLWVCVLGWHDFTARMFLASFAFYWLGTVGIMLAWPHATSPMGLFYVAFGFVPWFLVAVFVFPFFFDESI
jgi:hypothetical protein